MKCDCVCQDHTDGQSDSDVISVLKNRLCPQSPKWPKSKRGKKKSQKKGRPKNKKVAKNKKGQKKWPKKRRPKMVKVKKAQKKKVPKKGRPKTKK
jgi:hypothetical protein